MTIAFRSALELASMIRNKEISSRELTDYYIRRIERFDDKINSVIVHDFERARKAAGAHFIGKTNVPPALMDYQSFNEIYGTTNNPWNLDLIPGGSSGGSAAALAAGLTSLDAGSDIGGSIRNPAHFCGVYGHKPTFGIVPQQGHSVLPSTPALDPCVVGPMARSADDLRASLEIVAGPPHLDRRGWTLNLPRPEKKRLADYRVAVWPNDSHASVDLEIADRVQSLGDRIAALGATVSDTARPAIGVDATWRTYRFLLTGALSDVPDVEFEKRRQAVAELDPRDDSIGAFSQRASTQYHREWLQYNSRREQIRVAWDDFFTEWDILICPTVPTTAFPHDHSSMATRTISVNNENHPADEQLFWAGLFNVAHLPSTVFPTGSSKRGLPIGLQAVSAEYNDYISIDFARLMADEFGGFVPPDGYEELA